MHNPEVLFLSDKSNPHLLPAQGLSPDKMAEMLPEYPLFCLQNPTQMCPPFQDMFDSNEIMSALLSHFSIFCQQSLYVTMVHQNPSDIFPLLPER